VLDVAGLAVAYGSKRVLGDIDFAVAEREIVGLVGHNGAGKTTLLRAIAGLVAPAEGTMRFAGRPVLPGTTPALVRAGLSFVPQGNNIFRDLTVDENLRIARSTRAAAGPVSEDNIFRLFPVLRERLGQRAGSLSGGQQQMVALAGALLRSPRLIMLDEPSTGLAPVLVEEVFRLISALRRDFGMSIVVVDQNVAGLIEIVDRMYVFKTGGVVYSGLPDALRDSEVLWQFF
jgi:branched-chain amino acid transport system ATP-binding protein